MIKPETYALFYPPKRCSCKKNHLEAYGVLSPKDGKSFWFDCSECGSCNLVMSDDFTVGDTPKKEE